MIRRLLLLGVGLLAALSGVAFTLRPSLGPGGLVTTAFVLGVWTVALLGAAAAGLRRLTGSPADDGSLPAESDRPVYRVPGDALAERVAAVGASERDATERDAIRDRVRRAAVDVVARRDGLSEGEARDRVADGTWTDDEAAAALFTGGDARYDHVETDFRERFERAADAVADRFRGDGE